MAVDQPHCPRVQTATNDLNQALDELLAGRPVSCGTTQACGCSIMYARDG